MKIKPEDLIKWKKYLKEDRNYCGLNLEEVLDLTINLIDDLEESEKMLNLFLDDQYYIYYGESQYTVYDVFKDPMGYGNTPREAVLDAIKKEE